MEIRRPQGGGGGGSSRPPPAPAAACGQQREVKVRHIVTRMVSTDEAHFKDVVQRLTGKDSTAVAQPAAGSSGAAGRGGGGGGGEGGGRDGKGVVFEEPVMVVGELPSSEEMKRWCGY